MADRDLGFNITAVDNASKAFVKMAKQVDRLSQRLDRLDHKKVDVAVDVNTKNAQAQLAKLDAKSHKTALMVSAVTNALVAAGPAAVAAGAGFVAFAGLAVPSVKKVIEAQENLAEHWDELDNAQKNVAKNVHGLIDEYKNLAEQAEPSSLNAFNQAITTTRSILPDLVPIANNTADGFATLATEARKALAGPYWQHFFDFLANQAEPTMDAFGDVLGSTAHLVASLTQNILPLSQQLLHLAGAGLQATASFVDAHPELTQLGLAALAARGPLKAVGTFGRGAKAGLSGVGTEAAVAAGGLASLGAKVGNAGRGLRDFQAATKGAKASEKLLMLGSTQLAGKLGKLFGKGGWIGIGIAALGGFAYAMYKVTTVSTTLSGSVISNTKQIIKQAGNYRQASVAIGKQYAEAQKKADTANVVAHASGRAASLQTAAFGRQAARTAGVMKSQFATSLQHVSKVMGIGLNQAFMLAKKNNIDLTAGFKDGSKAAQHNANKLETLRQKMILINHPAMRVSTDWQIINNKSLTMKQRLQGVTDAFFGLNRALNMDQATINFNNATQQLTQSLKQNGHSFDLSTQAGRLNTQALISSSRIAQQNYSARIKQGLGVDTATAALKRDRLQAYRTMIQMGLSRKEAQRLTDKYYKIPGEVNTSVGTPGMKKAQDEIDTLKAKIQALKNKHIEVKATGAWTSIGGAVLGHGGEMHGPGHATGGPVYGPGTGTSDSIPTRLSNNEHVWTAREVKAAGGHGAVEAMRRAVLTNAPAFAQGGAVNRRIIASTTTPGVPPIPDQARRWLNAEISAWADSIAAAMRKALASSGASGPAQRYAASLLASHGWGLGQMAPLIKLWNRESGWNPNAVNPSSGAYGIPQALGHGHPFNLGDYRAQVRWGENYIDRRYGSPAAAWAHSQATGWYGKGIQGAVFREPTLIGVGESGPERVDVTPLRGGHAGSPPPEVTVRVFIGDRELTDIVDTRIEVHDETVSSALRAGRR